MDEQSINILRAEIERLQEQNSRLTSERDQLSQALDAIGQERDDLAAQISTPDEYRQQVEQLRGQIRTRDHRDVFNRLAAESGANPRALDALWKLSGYQPDSDAVDEARIRELVGQLRESADYAFAPGPGGSPATSPAGRPIPGAGNGNSNPQRPVPAAGRGGRLPAEEGGLTREQMADPKFMLDPRNKAYIKERIAPRGPLSVAS